MRRAARSSPSRSWSPAAFLHDDERLKDILDECTVALDKLLDELGADRVTDQKLIREDVNQRLSELVFQRTRRRPLIMPVVVEV